ncbi:chorismate lyase [Moraxella sp. ZY210820]|uniref:chorismate--pyruvate lyase family protein n=1 Tax=unclassified Moraxella TaxID=2685852 RepID=UPI00272F5631|nr:chorismate lyase [Moraxella sp. ZY210820]WLF83119.1 chorismate lyase [Moraxella sp. ZY210820]
MNKLAIPKHLQSWLYAQGSLTKQLTQLAQGQFAVQLQAEYYQRLTLQDSLWLDMPYHHVAWVRESYLLGVNRQAWVQAKSIFPILSMQTHARRFKTLKHRPMGHLLFSRYVPSDCQRRIIQLEQGWTRQNRYIWRNSCFIVQETFLPEFEQFILKSV